MTKSARIVTDAHPITTLQQLLDRLDKAATGDRVYVESTMEAAGRSSFGALLLLGGLVTLSPLEIVPGIPPLIALGVLLVCGDNLDRRVARPGPSSWRWRCRSWKQSPSRRTWRESRSRHSDLP